MAAFLIAEVIVTDDSWIPEYAAEVHNIAAKHGGKYLSRSGNITTIEGGDAGNTLIALIQFPDRASAQAFADDPEYAPFKQARIAGTQSHFQIIDDTDLAGSIPYLPKG